MQQLMRGSSGGGLLTGPCPHAHHVGLVPAVRVPTAGGALRQPATPRRPSPSPLLAAAAGCEWEGSSATSTSTTATAASSRRTRRGGRGRVGTCSASGSGSSSAATTLQQGQQQEGSHPAAAADTSPHDSEVLIEFRNVHKAFGSKVILAGCSFKIRRGEAVGIIGASGTGKSTTLRIAAGLLAPDSGDVLIHGKLRTGLISDSEEEEKVRIGMVFQNAALFDSLSVGENVGFLLYEHSDLPEVQIKALVVDSLAKVGLRGVEDLSPAALSGGMRKRVALARAVIPDLSNDTEKIVMYDEPTAGLDPVASTVVEDLMRDLHEGSKRQGNGSSSSNGSSGVAGRGSGITSYVVVTHQHSTIRRAVDRIIFLHQGVVVWEGTSHEFDTTDEPIVRQFAVGSLDGPISYV